MWQEARFWAMFLDWHVRSDHPWDLALHMEAMSLGIIGMSREIAERLTPAIEKAAAAFRTFGENLAKAGFDTA